MQQVAVISAVAMALAWLWWAWGWSRAAALGGALLLAGGYAIVLALEFVLVFFVNRQDPVPRAGPWVLARAWWQEVRVAPRVFAWRQPFRWRYLPDDDEAVQGDRATPAVVFVHGFVCNRGLWLPWMQALRERGIRYTSVNLEPVFGPIDDYVKTIDDAVYRAKNLTGLEPLVVCHSMGGLALRAWAATTPGAAARVQHVVTIGTPHHGTWLGQFSHVINGKQMRRDSPWLKRLQAREAQMAAEGSGLTFTCWYSNADNIVLPASTAMLADADNRHVPGVPHVALAFHPRVMQESLAMLASAASSPKERTVP